MSPVIKGTDGVDRYHMRPGFGRAIEKARGEEQAADAESAKPPAKRMSFERMDDGTITSRIERESDDDATGGAGPTSMAEPETATHANWADAATCMQGEDEAS